MMSGHMIKYSTPEHDETTWATLARKQRNDHPTIVAERDLVEYVQRRLDAEYLRRERWTDFAPDTVWWRPVCASYTRARSWQS